MSAIAADKDFHASVRQQIGQGRVQPMSDYFREAVARRIGTSGGRRLACDGGEGRQDPEAEARARRRARKVQEIPRNRWYGVRSGHGVRRGGVGWPEQALGPAGVYAVNTRGGWVVGLGFVLGALLRSET